MQASLTGARIAMSIQYYKPCVQLHFSGANFHHNLVQFPLVRVLTLNMSLVKHRSSPVDPSNFLGAFQNLISEVWDFCPRNIADATRRVKRGFFCWLWDHFNICCKHYNSLLLFFFLIKREAQYNLPSTN